MTRREFIGIFGGAVVAWPFGTQAQQPSRVRRIGILLPASAEDTEFQTWTGAFMQGLAPLGWTIGRNVRLDTRWATPNTTEIRKQAAELITLAPDVILAHGAATVSPLLQLSRTVPIIFVVVSDPVAIGVVDSLSRPGGNATGFMNFEYSIPAKWLELLKEVAPGVTRVAVARDATQGGSTAALAAIQAVAATFKVEVSPINVNDATDIERAFAAFASTPNGGVIVPAGGRTLLHRELLIALATRYKLPALYSSRTFVTAGGLISYGPDFADQYRRAAGYVDRILKGDKPTDLPVQAPTQFATVLNLKTAKALGITVPPSVLARADEVIE